MKRFNRVGGYVYDGDKCISHFEDVSHRDDIVKLLNEQHEQIQELQMRYDAQRELYCELDCVKNNLYQENEQLKKELLFFYDVANCECSTNWKDDMEKGCKRFFNCTYEEAKEKYGDYDGMWWEIND